VASTGTHLYLLVDPASVRAGTVVGGSGELLTNQAGDLSKPGPVTVLRW
jgi:hypothetical protein